MEHNKQKGLVVLAVAVENERELMVIWKYDFQEGKAYEIILELDWVNHTDYGLMLNVDKTQVIDWADSVENVRQMIRRYEEGQGWKVYYVVGNQKEV
jgi:hypothetical protein